MDPLRTLRARAGRAPKKGRSRMGPSGHPYKWDEYCYACKHAYAYETLSTFSRTISLFFKCLGSSQVLKIKVPGGHEDLKNGMRYQIHQGLGCRVDETLDRGLHEWGYVLSVYPWWRYVPSLWVNWRYVVPSLWVKWRYVPINQSITV